MHLVQFRKPTVRRIVILTNQELARLAGGEVELEDASRRLLEGTRLEIQHRAVERQQEIVCVRTKAMYRNEVSVHVDLQSAARDGRIRPRFAGQAVHQARRQSARLAYVHATLLSFRTTWDLVPEPPPYRTVFQTEVRQRFSFYNLS